MKDRVKEIAERLSLQVRGGITSHGLESTLREWILATSESLHRRDLVS